MSTEQVARNILAQHDLIRGKYYRFNPPVRAGAIPTGGPRVCAIVECEFDRGWYIGFVDGKHVFQGKPVNDAREIKVPSIFRDTPDPEWLKERLRASYFHILFIGGSQAILDPNQGD
jgi:hypothetical protein